MGLVCGIGINDANYSVVGYSKDISGKTTQTMCKYYRTWKSMLRRCYDEKDNLSYNSCTVCEEWYRFSNFKAWMEKQNHEGGLHLDKDILVPGNKVYSPKFCVFVPNRINSQAKIPSKANSTGFLGVVRETRGKVVKYRAQVGTSRALRGAYLDPKEAHFAWQLGRAAQIENLVSWYATQDCFRTDVADALLVRVWKLRTENVLKTITKEV